MSDSKTTDKKQNLPTVDIKGQPYTLVKDRVLYFNEKYPNGYIGSNLVSPYDSDLIVIKAFVCPDAERPERIFSGYSQATVGDGYINKTSALENCETSAVGRALAMMGIGVIESIASADEINKAQTSNQQSGGQRSSKTATDKQIAWMRSEAKQVSGLEEAEDLDGWMAESDVLNMKPQNVPSWKVGDAVEKIRKLKDKTIAADPDPSDLPVITEQDLKELDEGKLDY